MSLRLPIWIAALVLACSCRPQMVPSPQVPTPPPETLFIGLTQSAGQLAALIGEPYGEQTERTRLEFIMANKTTLLQDLSDGLIDAALVHDVSDDGALWINPVALDGLGILVHPDNPVSELSRTQVRGLFSGMYQSWSEVGGRDRPITLIVREEGSGAREIFDQRIMDGRSPNPLSFIAPGSNSMTDLISNDEGAIGFGLLGSTGSVKILSIEGMAPSPEKLSAQEYPLTVPLYFVSLQEPQGRLREFLAWLQSSVGQETLGVQYGRVR